jgi:hypothetical protein
MWKSFLLFRGSSQRVSKATHPRSGRLALEALEDRCLPATLLVTTSASTGAGSLADAVSKAATGDIITFSPTLNGQPITLTSPLTIANGITIKGLGLSVDAINGGSTGRVFNVTSSSPVTISGVTITNGRTMGANENGGAILDSGNLTLDSDFVNGSQVFGPGSEGGAIAVTGAGASLTITNSTVAASFATGGGGGIFIDTGTTVTISASIIVGHTAGPDVRGAGINNLGTLTINTTTFGLNVGAAGNFSGGAINNAAGATLNLNSSTLLGNAANGSGGGLNNDGTATIIDCTFVVDNVNSNVGSGGAAIRNTGTLTIDDSTLTANADGSSKATSAGNISTSGGTVILNNDIVAEGRTASGPAPDINGTVSSSSTGNFIGAADANLVGITDGVNMNQVGTVAMPKFDQITIPQNNGGPTQTRAPLPGSPVIDTGNAAAVPASLKTDQRGFNRIVNGKVDIGAVEFQPPQTTTTLTVSATSGTAPVATLTAVVAGPTPDSNIPTGSVSFYTGGTLSGGNLVGGTLLGTMNLDATGKAVLPVSTPGVYQFTAVYNGNLPLFVFGSTSTQVSQVLGSKNQVYVNKLFQKLLGRAADAGGLALFSGLLDQGASPVAVVRAIENSPEYLNDQVQATFQQYLHRAADPTGLAAFSSFLANGGTLEALAAMLIASPEYFQTRGQGNNTQFLAALFQDALMRPIDATGDMLFSQALAGGVSRLAIAGVILTSAEYRTDQVQGYFMKFLGRSADPMGLSSFVGALEAGTLDQDVIAMIAGSPEAFQRAQSG